MLGWGFDFKVDTLLFRVDLEVEFRRGIFLRWTLFDAGAVEREAEHQRKRFYRPTEVTPTLDMDERFRLSMEA